MRRRTASWVDDDNMVPKTLFTYKINDLLIQIQMNGLIYNMDDNINERFFLRDQY